MLAHEKILAAYLNGVTWPRNSKVLIFDMVPNRPKGFQTNNFQVQRFQVWVGGVVEFASYSHQTDAMLLSRLTFNE